MTEFAKLTDDETDQIYLRAAAQTRIIAEDMLSDPDLQQLFGDRITDPDHQKFIIGLLDRIMSLGAILGIKSASGSPLSDNTWQNFLLRGTENDDGD